MHKLINQHKISIILSKFYLGITFFGDLFRNTRIQNRLFFSFLLLSIAPLIICGVVSYNKTSSDMKEKISEFSLQIINHAGEKIVSTLQQYERLEIDIAVSSDIQNALENYVKKNEQDLYQSIANINSVISEYANTRPEILSIDVIINKDRKVSSIFTSLSDKDDEMINKSTDSVNGKTALNVVDLIYPQGSSPGVSEKCLVLSKQIISVNTKKKLGYLRIYLKNDCFSKPIEGIDVGKGSEVFIMSTDGIIIGSRDSDNSLGSEYGEASITSEVTNFNNNFSQTIDGKYCMVVSSKVPNENLFVVASIPYDYINSELNDVRKSIIFTAFLCIVFALLFSYIITSGIARPLGKLMQFTKEVMSGNFDVKIEDRKNDEIAVLTSSFNDMLIKIKELINNVYIAEMKKNSEVLRRKEAELDALQMQINPHFIYNTLNIIRWEAIFQQNGENKLSDMIQTFSSLLRLSTKKNDKLVTISEEIEHINTYLKVIAFRYKENFGIEWEIEKGLEECRIVKLTLQPPVENAIIHGLTGIQGERNISIKVKSFHEDIIIQIVDNGKGIEKSLLERIRVEINLDERNENSKLGLKNVNDRIKLHFGSNYGLHIYSVYGKGTSVEVTIPKIIEIRDEGINEQTIQGIDC